MSLLDSITSILLPSKDKGLLCPKCERELSRHDPDYCKRAMSRRTFFMGVGGVIATAAGASLLPKAKAGTGGLFNPVADIAAQYRAVTLSKFDITKAPVEQLVVEAAPKIVTAGVRDYLRVSSNGNWGPKPAGMKINPHTGYAEMLVEKSDAQILREAIDYGHELGGCFPQRREDAPEYRRRQTEAFAERRRQERADKRRREVRIGRFSYKFRHHPSAVRFANDQTLTGPKGKLPA